ncbi:MAG TPA: hypothetical protein VFI24_04390 [Pyrinomonadaceae bacterium]|nr:hypothetical protein [Pyrinomonadaceae bacterium]
MKKHLVGVATTAFTFMLSIAIGAARLPAPQHSDEPEPQPVSTTINESEEDCFSLIDDNNFHSKLNGWKLPQDGESLSHDDINAAKIIPISSGGLITGAGTTLSRFDSQKRVVWQYEVPQWLIDFDVVESTGLVYGTAGDNIMFILDLSSGKELKSISRNGSAAFGEVKAYGTNECLVTDAFGVYREKGPRDMEPMQDGLTGWRGTRELWHIDFPADAELIVKGKRIFAVTKTKTSVYIKEIFPPLASK